MPRLFIKLFKGSTSVSEKVGERISIYKGEHHYVVSWEWLKIERFIKFFTFKKYGKSGLYSTWKRGT